MYSGFDAPGHLSNAVTRTVGTATSFDTNECISAITNIDDVMKQEESAIHQQLFRPTLPECNDNDNQHALLERRNSRDSVDLAEV